MSWYIILDRYFFQDAKKNGIHKIVKWQKAKVFILTQLIRWIYLTLVFDLVTIVLVFQKYVTIIYVFEKKKKRLAVL